MKFDEINVSKMEQQRYDDIKKKGKYVELFNSDKDVYGGYNQYNGLPLKTTEFGPYGLPHKVTIKLASFGAIILKYKGAR